MRSQVSRKDMVKFSIMAMVMCMGIAVDLILFGCGVILSMATVTVPFVLFASGLLYSLMRLNIMEFSNDTYCDRLNREVNAKAARKQKSCTCRRRTTHHRSTVQRKHYAAA